MREYDPDETLRARTADVPDEGRERARDDDTGETARTGARAVIDGKAAMAPPSSVFHLQRAAGNAGVAASLQREEESPVKEVVGRGGGRALDAEVRRSMESRIGADFSDVRVHDDSAAGRSAQAVGAHAYTVGNEIVFQPGGYQPDSAEGQRTLAHELTHVVQQRHGPVDATPAGGGIAVSDPSDPFEREAERNAERVMGTQRDASSPAAATVSASVQRDADDDALQMLALQRQEETEEEEEPAGDAEVVEDEEEFE